MQLSGLHSLEWSIGRPSAMQWYMVERWSEAGWAEGRRWAEGVVEEVVRVKGLHEGTAWGVSKVATGADQRALGVQVDMEGYWGGAVEGAGAKVRVAARATKQIPSVESLVEVS